MEDNNWISVEDRLPDNYNPVLCLNEKSGKQMVCEKYHTITDISHKFVYNHEGLYYGFSATHWQPLPSPPKQSSK